MTPAASVIWTTATKSPQLGTDPYAASWQARCMTRLPSLYKARGIPVKSPICAICLDRTRGRTLERQLTHGVRIWLCEGHHSVAFMRSNAGRDFVVTLMRTWRSHGCLTRARTRALEAHLGAIRSIGGRAGRPRPGSLDRTRGKTLERQLTHGVRIWLCEGHHSVEFMRSNAGRDFAVTLMRIWRSQGCMTRARTRALDAHLRAIRATGAGIARSRPGSTPGLGSAAKPSATSHGAATSSRLLIGSGSGTCSTTPPCRASARCAAGSASAAGCGRPGPRARVWPDAAELRASRARRGARTDRRRASVPGSG